MKILVTLFLLSSVQTYVASVILTIEEFNLSVTSNGYPPPSEEIYDEFAKNAGNFSRGEVAMLIAQLVHESGGFQFTEQLVCLQGNRCRGLYDDGTGLPNKTYYGRGFIQLTWAANYRVASENLGLGDILLKNPDLVATDDKINMLVSVWYWKSRVQPLIQGKENQFGLTTKGINPLECVRVNRYAKRRYRIYQKIAGVLKLKNKAKESGCYS